MFKTKLRKNKRRIQKRFYVTGKKKYNVATFVAGPSPAINNKLIRSVANRGISYEIDPVVKKKQSKTRNPYIKYKLGNISEADPTLFMDLDLMKTLETQYPIIINIINKQKTLRGTKFLLLTVSLRLVGIKTTLRLLDAILLASNIKLEEYIYEVYSDGSGPMASFKIKYK